jgi:hypothetical protein
MRVALTRERRADCATAVLIARPRPGYEGDSQNDTHTEQWASRRAEMITRDTLRVANSDKFRKSSKFSIKKVEY